jgi:DnaK suppressor protein
MSKSRQDTAPKGVTKRLLVALRRELEGEREQLRAQAERFEADFRDESWKDRSSDDEAEVGSAVFERERAASLAQHARSQMLRIDEALRLMDEGTYGACASCGQLIDRARLEARPQSVLCLDCQRRQERGR